MPDSVQLARTRAALLNEQTGLPSSLASMRAEAQAAGPLNPFYWRTSMLSVISAHLVGLGADARVREMLRLVVDQLAAERVTGLARHTRLAESLYEEAGAHETRALGRWLLTGERPTDAFAAAASTYAAFGATFGPDATWSADKLARLTMLRCAADQLADVQMDLAARGRVPTSKARSPIDIGRAWATVDRVGLHGAARRVHRTTVRAAKRRGGYDEVALSTYFTALVCSELPREPAGVRGLFDRAAAELA